MPRTDLISTPRAFIGRAPAHLKEPPRCFVVFRLDRQNYALPLENVTRALRMVALTPIPDTVEGVLGVINMAGRIIPVIDLRRRLGHPKRAPELNDRMLVLDLPGQTLAVIADAVLDVLELDPHQVSPPPLALAPSQPLAATIQQADELILVLDAARLMPAAKGQPTSPDTQVRG
jgi:purine-binding chemotaxis protein CheW